MLNVIHEVMYDLYKDGKFTGTSVGFLYSNDRKWEEKFNRLKADYPEKEGYELKNEKLKTMCPPVR